VVGYLQTLRPLSKMPVGMHDPCLECFYMLISFAADDTSAYWIYDNLRERWCVVIALESYNVNAGEPQPQRGSSLSGSQAS
jgi:hypothetical protein